MQTENEKAVRGQKELWLVLDETGEPIHCASWPSACHEHINDAINEFQIEGADKWRVIQAAPKAPQQVSNTPQDGEVKPPASIIDQMANRFLMWKLPKNFTPDGGISFKPYPVQTYEGSHWPIGTNLFDVEQAKEMIRYMLDGAVFREKYDTEAEGESYMHGYFDAQTPPQQQEQKHGSAGSSPLDSSGEAEVIGWVSLSRGDVSKSRLYFEKGEEIAPLYLAPPTSTAIAAMVIHKVTDKVGSWLRSAEIRLADVDTRTDEIKYQGIVDELRGLLTELRALTPANAEAELEALKYDACMKVAQAVNAYYLLADDLNPKEVNQEPIRAIVRRVLDEKGE